MSRVCRRVAGLVHFLHIEVWESASFSLSVSVSVSPSLSISIPFSPMFLLIKHFPTPCRFLCLSRGFMSLDDRVSTALSGIISSLYSWCLLRGWRGSRRHTPDLFNNPKCQPHQPLIFSPWHVSLVINLSILASFAIWTGWDFKKNQVLVVFSQPALPVFSLHFNTTNKRKPGHGLNSVLRNLI